MSAPATAPLQEGGGRPKAEAERGRMRAAAQRPLPSFQCSCPPPAPRHMVRCDAAYGDSLSGPQEPRKKQRQASIVLEGVSRGHRIRTAR
jgi:hypothetical protein